MRRGKWITAGICAAVVSSWIYIAVSPEPTLPAGLADGVYENACCGALTLHRGEMHLAGQTVRYVIQADKVGTYVLPAHYVGIVDGKTFDMEHDRPGEILRLDVRANPHTIDISARHATFRFSRRAM